MKKILLGSAVAICTSLLAPPAASALDFTFSTPGLSGLIQGLIDNATIAPATIMLTTGRPGEVPIGTYSYLSNLPPPAPGFTVTGGQIAILPGDPIIEYELTLSDPVIAFGDPRFEQYGLAFYFGGIGVPLLCPDSRVGCPILESRIRRGNSSGSTIEAVSFLTASPPSSAVPGPLPLLGAAAAFSFSRKLRKCIKSNGNPVSSSYTI
jgi:hypothetical protein